MLTMLTGRGRGKYGEIAVTAYGFDEGRREALVEVLGDLEAQDGVEGAAKVDGLPEIADLDHCPIDVQLVWVGGSAIEPCDIREPHLSGRVQPRAHAGSDVQQARDLAVRQDTRQAIPGAFERMQVAMKTVGNVIHQSVPEYPLIECIPLLRLQSRLRY
jgi:hypothetical protein